MAFHQSPMYPWQSQFDVVPSTIGGSCRSAFSFLHDLRNGQPTPAEVGIEVAKQGSKAIGFCGLRSSTCLAASPATQLRTAVMSQIARSQPAPKRHVGVTRSGPLGLAAGRAIKRLCLAEPSWGGRVVLFRLDREKPFPSAGASEEKMRLYGLARCQAAPA